MTLYNSFVYPYIKYCIEVWGGASDKSIKSLFKVQKRAVRIIKSASYLAHTRPIFHALNILNIYKIYEFKVSLFMYKMEMQLLPSLFSDMFVKILMFITIQLDMLIIYVLLYTITTQCIASKAPT